MSHVIILVIWLIIIGFIGVGFFLITEFMYKYIKSQNHKRNDPAKYTNRIDH